MTDDFSLQPGADDDALSAYLAGDMDDAEAAAFEQRLGAEPALAGRLDVLAEALVTLGGFDEAAPPDGFEERLDARLAAERGAAAPADLAAHRRRRERSRLWLGVGTAAAVVALAAVMGGSVLQGMDGRDTVASDAAGEAALESSAGGSESAASAADGPVIVDDRVVVADEDALQERFSDVAEAQSLLGTPLDEARGLEQRYAKAVAQRRSVTAGSASAYSTAPDASAPALSQPPADRATTTDEADQEAAAEESAEGAGPPPAPAAEGGSGSPGTASGGGGGAEAEAGDPCLAAIRQGAPAPSVPVRVESLRYDGKAAIAYVFVTAAPGSTALDRTEVWVVARKDCAVLVFQQY